MCAGSALVTRTAPTGGVKTCAPVPIDDPMALRDLILLGVRVHETEQSFENIERLLEHWTGMKRPVKSAANSSRHTT